jgi:hypothetical protein
VKKYFSSHGSFKFIIMSNTIRIIFFTVLLLGCKKDEIKPQGIEFYLLEDDSSFNSFGNSCKDFDFNNQKLKGTPIITNEDILKYEWKGHEVTISQNAFTKLKSHRDKAFVIYPLVLMINGERIYGLFYKYAILAVGCETTLITESGLGNTPINGGANFTIIHGQVVDKSTLSRDPRGDKRIYDYLKSTGRLVE